MDCNQTVKELRAYCRKHGIKGYSGLRKKELCQHIKKHQSLPKRITGEKVFQQRDCSRKHTSWSKKQLLEFCQTVGIKCSSRDTKKGLCREISAHFKGDAPESINTFSTKHDFDKKECGPPRRGWLHRELVAVCKALGLHCGKKNKKQLCSLLGDHFEDQSRRASSGRRRRHRTRAPPGNKLTSKSYMERLPPDIARFTGHLLPIREILKLCDSNPLLSRHLCSTGFWRDYYIKNLQLIRKTGELKDWDFAALVSYKVYNDWLVLDGRPAVTKVNIAIQPENSDEFILIPILVPKQSQQKRRKGGSLARKVAKRIESVIGDDIVNVYQALQIPAALKGWETRGKKMFKRLKAIASQI